MSKSIHLTYSFLLSPSSVFFMSNSSDDSLYGARAATATKTAAPQFNQVSSASLNSEAMNTNKNPASSIALNTSKIPSSTNKVQFGSVSSSAAVQQSASPQDVINSIRARKQSSMSQSISASSSNNITSASASSFDVRTSQQSQVSSNNVDESVNHNVGTLKSVTDLNKMQYGDMGIYQGLKVFRVHCYHYFRTTGSIPVYSDLVFSKLNKVVTLPNSNLTALIQRAFKVENASGQSDIRLELKVVGKTYFIDKNSKFVKNAYLQKSDVQKEQSPYVMIVKPISYYKQATLKEPVAQLKQYTNIAIKKVIPLDDDYQSATCLETTNGYYITGNTNYVKLV